MRESLESTKQRYPHHTHYQGLDDDNDEPRAQFVCCPFPCAVCYALCAACPSRPIIIGRRQGKATHDKQIVSPPLHPTHRCRRFVVVFIASAAAAARFVQLYKQISFQFYQVVA